MTSVWAGREQRVLDAVAAFSADRNPGCEDLAEATGLAFASVQTGVRNLEEAGFLTGMDVSTMGVGYELIEIRLLERGLRATGVWPSDPYDQFVDAVNDAIENETDPAQRSRLQGLLDAMKDVGKGVATAVISDVVKRSTGLP